MCFLEAGSAVSYTKTLERECVKLFLLFRINFASGFCWVELCRSKHKLISTFNMHDRKLYAGFPVARMLLVFLLVIDVKL